MIRVLVGVAAALLAAFLYTEYNNTNQNQRYENRQRQERTSRSRRKRREEVVSHILNGSLVCNICLDNCERRHSVWFCEECCSPFHVLCLRKWIQIEGSIQKPPTCPDCRETVNTPIRNLCMCGGSIPVHRQNHNVLPFSCGGTCSKGCGDPCHPGKCF